MEGGHSLAAAIYLVMREFQKNGLPEVPYTLVVWGTMMGFRRLHEEGITNPFQLGPDRLESEIENELSCEQFKHPSLDTRYLGETGYQWDSGIALSAFGNSRALGALKDIDPKVAEVFCAPIQPIAQELIKRKSEFERRLGAAESEAFKKHKAKYPKLPWAGD